MQDPNLRRERDPLLIAAALVALAIAVLVSFESAGWVGRTFPGFLVLENRVIASAGLTSWPDATASVFQQEVVAVDGVRVKSGRDVARLVAAAPVGALHRYTLRDRHGVREVEIPSRRFERTDWSLLFGTYLFCGIGLCGIALCVRYLRGSDPAAGGMFVALFAAGLWALTAVDLYGPHRLFRIHAFSESLLAACIVHLAFAFPAPRGGRKVRLLLPASYVFCAAVSALNQIWLYEPNGYRFTHSVAQTSLGLALLVFVCVLARDWFVASSFQTRQRLKVVSVGSSLALAPQVVLALLASATGKEAPQNLLAFSGMLFPASLAYAVLRQNLLGVDEMLRRVLNYVVLTIAVTALYGGLVFAFDTLLPRAPQSGLSAFSLVLGPVSVLALLPLRDRLQSALDRVFFRAAWDFRRVVGTASARLASVTDLKVIALEIRQAVGETLHPEWLAFYVRRENGGELACLGPACPDSALGQELLSLAEQSVLPQDGRGGTLVVPFRAESGVVAALLLGRPLSGSLYGGYDRGLLHTLANQGALAVENARALEQLRELNRDLENKVEDRTRHLRAALRELRETQAQLVHREKMASVGQFVAGIAHEMNNPLSFIEGNLHFMESYANTLAAAIERYEAELASAGAGARADEIRRELDINHVVSDLKGVLEGCGEGVVRTAGLVRDLRTFSRVDHAELMPVDLHEAIDSTLNLLRGQLKEIEITRAYGELPSVECLGGQINQVLMNLLANAADAVQPGGHIVVRTEALPGERVAFEVQDDGCGIAPDCLERIFDPFFTTKEPGKGTGLGLSISYGVVIRHGGTVTVRSELGRGSCFRVELPVRFSPPDSGLE